MLIRKSWFCWTLILRVLVFVDTCQRPGLLGEASHVVTHIIGPGEHVPLFCFMPICHRPVQLYSQPHAHINSYEEHLQTIMVEIIPIILIMIKRRGRRTSNPPKIKDEWEPETKGCGPSLTGSCFYALLEPQQRAVGKWQRVVHNTHSDLVVSNSRA